MRFLALDDLISQALATYPTSDKNPQSVELI